MSNVNQDKLLINVSIKSNNSYDTNDNDDTNSKQFISNGNGDVLFACSNNDNNTLHGCLSNLSHCDVNKIMFCHKNNNHNHNSTSSGDQVVQGCNFLLILFRQGCNIFHKIDNG